MTVTCNQVSNSINRRWSTYEPLCEWMIFGVQFEIDDGLNGRRARQAVLHINDLNGRPY